jgi:hypothetical protein
MFKTLQWLVLAAALAASFFNGSQIDPDGGKNGVQIDPNGLTVENDNRSQIDPNG